MSANFPEQEHSYQPESHLDNKAFIYYAGIHVGEGLIIHRLPGGNSFVSTQRIALHDYIPRDVLIDIHEAMVDGKTVSIGLLVNFQVGEAIDSHQRSYNNLLHANQKEPLKGYVIPVDNPITLTAGDDATLDYIRDHSDPTLMGEVEEVFQQWCTTYTSQQWQTTEALPAQAYHTDYHNILPIEAITNNDPAVFDTLWQNKELQR